MSIYVGDKKAKLYRGDYCPAQLYKGDVKIAGYTDHEKVGTQISGVDTYNDALNLTIEGVSEQTVTVQRKNLFDEERILPAQGWVKQSDGSFFVSNNSIPYGKVLWENTDGYTGQIFVTIQNRRTEVGSQYTGAFPAIVYTDGSRSIALDFRDVEWTSNAVISDNTKTVKQIVWSYGTGAIGTYVKDLLIAKSNTIVPYEPFVPNSPSPDYPSPIRSSENFDVISFGRDTTIATTAHVTDPLRSVGNVSDSIEVSNGKVEVIRRIAVVKLTGDALTEGWEQYLASVGKRYICMFGNFLLNKLVGDIFCTHAKQTLISTIAGTELEIWTHTSPSSASYMYWGIEYSLIGTNQTSTAEENKASFRAWLSAQATAGTPVTILYQLATPTRTDITTTPLGQEFLALRTQPRYTQVYTNATLPPTLRAKIKEMEL